MKRMKKPEDSDDLIERWIGGDRAVGQALYDRYYKRAWKFGLAITRQENEADEVAAEALAHGLDIVRDPGRRPQKFTGWLLGVVKHLAWRRGRRSPPLPLELSLEDKRYIRPSGAMIETEMAGLLKQALATLSREDRDLVNERFVRKTSRPEMSRKLGCSIDTIDRRLKMAVARLRSFLSGHFTTLILTGTPPTMDRILALRPSFRLAFIARHIDCLSADEAADKLGIPVDTLNERLHYAYSTLGCSERTDFASLRRPV